MQRIHLADHGLVGRTGHHFDYAFNLARGLKARGHQVEVFGHRAATADIHTAFAAEGIGFHGQFADSPYDRVLLDAGLQTRWTQRIRRIATELEAVAAADFCLFPTLVPEHFAAFTSLPTPPPLAGLVHFPPDALHPLGGQAWGTACERALARDLRVTVGALDPKIAEVLRAAGNGFPLRDLPIPADGWPREDYPQGPRRIGFFGHQRLERGLDLLPALVTRLLDDGYEVLVHDSRGRLPTAGPPRLRVRHGFLPDLPAELRGCDLVVIPMDPRRYALRTSGIAMCAAACGVPFVLPAGTLPALRFQPQGCCEASADPGPEGLLGAVRKIAADYPAYAGAAAATARRWRERHGTDRFLDAVLALPGQPA